MNKDFLYVVFEDFDENKSYMESCEKRKNSDEEFIQKLYDINYLRTIYNLDGYSLSDEDYKKLFDEIIYNRKYNNQEVSK